MTTQSPVLNYPNPANDTPFAKNMVKVLTKGTTVGTLIASFGLSNVPNNLHIIDQTRQDMKNYFAGIIQLSNGVEIQLSSDIRDIKENNHFSVDEGIDYKAANEIADIMLWTDMSKEAIILKDSNPPLYNFQNTYNSRLADYGILETTPIQFDNNTFSESLNDTNLYKFEKQIHSKVIIAGDYPTTPIEWD